MSRRLWDHQTSVFRATVVTAYMKEDGDESRHEAMFGPYATHGQAASMITRERRRLRDRPGYDFPSKAKIVDCYVEQSVLNWEKVGNGQE